MRSIGVRELRQHASRWLALVAGGESFEVTDRGRPVAVLGPIPEGGLDRLRRAGAVRPGVGSLSDVQPVATAGTTLSELVEADREDRV